MITRRKRRPRFGGERAHQNVGDDLLCAKLLGERHVVRRHEHGAVVGDAHEGHAREGHHVERHQAAAAGPDREKALGAPVADRRENGVFGHVGAAGTVGQRGAHAGLDPEEEFGRLGLRGAAREHERGGQRRKAPERSGRHRGRSSLYVFRLVMRRVAGASRKAKRTPAESTRPKLRTAGVSLSTRMPSERSVLPSATAIA